MAYTPQADQYNNTPNTGNVFDQQTSFQEDLFDSISAHGGGEMGVGSFKIRDIDDLIVQYEPANTAVNTMIMLTGSTREVSTVVPEWAEDDAMLPIDAEGVHLNATDVINNTTGNETYVPATSNRFIVSAEDGAKFRVYDKVRYENEDGGFTYAHITAIAPASTDIALTLNAIDGSTNLPVADSNTAAIQLMETSVGSDLDKVEQPRGTNPKMYYTFMQKLEGTGAWTERSANESNIFDQMQRAQDQAFNKMNQDLESLSLYGSPGKYQLSNGDWVYFSPGLYDSAKENNYHTSDYQTSSSFDANKFKNALYSAVKFNFGAESGGPQIRQAFMDGQFSNYLDQAFEDKQRFYGNEFVGGVKVNRFEISDGILDFIRTPQFEIRHPIPGASLRQDGTPRAVTLVVPIPETVERLYFNNENLRAEVYQKKNGGEEWFYKVRYTCGLAHKLRQYSFVLEEVAE